MCTNFTLTASCKELCRQDYHHLLSISRIVHNFLICIERFSFYSPSCLSLLLDLQVALPPWSWQPQLGHSVRRQPYRCSVVNMSFLLKSMSDLKSPSSLSWQPWELFSFALLTLCCHVDVRHLPVSRDKAIHFPHLPHLIPSPWHFKASGLAHCSCPPSLPNWQWGTPL